MQDQRQLNREVSETLKRNIIVPSEFPVCSLVVILPAFALTSDCLTARFFFNSEPMPDSDEMFSKLYGHKLFSKIDLTKGY